MSAELLSSKVLIQEEEPRLNRQRPRERDALPLAAR